MVAGEPVVVPISVRKKSVKVIKSFAGNIYFNHLLHRLFLDHDIIFYF